MQVGRDGYQFSITSEASVTEHRVLLIGMYAAQNYMLRTVPGDFPVDSWYTEQWYSAFWGDADRLLNGNVLVTGAIRTATEGSRVFEVTPAGQIVWENRVARKQRVVPRGTVVAAATGTPIVNS